MEQKKINKNIIFSVVGVLLLIAVVAGATYAYFSATASTAVQTVTTGSLTMGFTNGDIVRADGLAPIADSEIKTKAAELDFSVTNTGTEHMKLTISLTDIVIPDALKDVDFRWGLYNKDTGVGLSFGIFKDIGTATSMVIYRDTIIDAVEDPELPDITNNYTLRIWIHDDGALQNYMQGQTFSAKVTVDGEAVQYTDEDCFTFNNGTITEYDEATCGTDVAIPKTIDGVTVTSIGEYAFGDLGITSVIIPNTVTSIGSVGISGNSFSHLTIPESVISLGEGTFTNNEELITVALPDSITSLPIAAFAANSSLVHITIPGSVSDDMGNQLVLGCSSLSSIVLMDGITAMYSDMAPFLDGAVISEIELPSSLSVVDAMTFSGATNLTKIIVRGKTSLADFEYSDGLTTEGGLPEGVTIEFRP